VETRRTGEMKPGFPRFKPRHEFFTLCYPVMYLEVQGNTIVLPTGGGGNWEPKRFPNIVEHLTETPPEHFREVAVTRDARSTCYCSFVYGDAEQNDHDGMKNTQEAPHAQPHGV
jgi:putative transposase